MDTHRQHASMAVAVRANDLASSVILRRLAAELVSRASARMPRAAPANAPQRRPPGRNMAGMHVWRRSATERVIRAQAKMTASEARSSALTLSKGSGEERVKRSGDDVSRSARTRGTTPPVMPVKQVRL